MVPKRRQASSKSSVELEARCVVLLELAILLFLSQKTVSYGKRLDLRAHEAAERVLRGTDDGLASDIETGIDQYGTVRAPLELSQKRVIPRIGLLVHGLDACRIVYVCDRGDIRPRNVEFVDA